MDDKKIQFLTDALLSHYDNYDRGRVCYMRKGIQPITYDRTKGHNVNVSYALRKYHVPGDFPIAVYFDKSKGRIIAFDIDKDLNKVPEELRESERQRLKQATIDFIKILHNLDLGEFTYFSGSKGYHVEIRTKEFMDVSKLVHVCEIIKQMADELGIGEYLDRIYPKHGAAYKIFGPKHPKTGKFTFAVDEGLNELTEEQSWLQLLSYDQESCTDTKQIEQICRTHKVKPVERKLISPPLFSNKKNLPLKNDKVEANGDKRVSELVDIYNCGLRNTPDRLPEHRTRHYASFQLGRYLRFIEKRTEDDSVELAKNWLYRHYPESGLQYFGDEANQALNDSRNNYELGLEDTIQSVRNAFSLLVKPFSGRTYIKLNEENLQAFINEIAYRREKETGIKPAKMAERLEYVISLVRDFKTFYVYHSREQFKAGFHTKDQRTITQMFDVLQNLGILKRLETGDYLKHKCSKYEITLPANCYKKIRDVEIPTDKEISMYG